MTTSKAWDWDKESCPIWLQPSRPGNWLLSACSRANRHWLWAPETVQVGQKDKARMNDKACMRKFRCKKQDKAEQLN
jgi:hypothetical protein